ncbi:cation diffusion facilitator family transporter [Actinoplanes sichuanensis]|uniref:Cation diffusion facilitator family transporter n=1 Tax=Actinoplanes sichuanensis TaxID=512349 RepID=A0ABW4ARY2_9ACTN|nr:cation diffusion facilitator family transporter [Actinoplanes sichuanensis]BEL05909.1 cation diffusion facilitator family transporter [Actinoplanes sichuanensis]
MGAGHNHGTHAFFDNSGEHQRRLWSVAVLLTVFMLAETAAAVTTGSLALLSDAGHMFTDVLAIAMTLTAITAARRAGTDSGRTYGLYRLEVLAALANAALLTGVAGFVLVQAARRFTDPPHVPAGWMLLVAVGGLVANLAAFALLRSGARENIGVRGAYLEVLGDLIGSAGVILAAVIIGVTGWTYADPIVAVLVALMILPRTFALGRSAIRILVQAAPEHVDMAEVRERLAAVPGVRDVHNLHVWTLTEGMDVASAHLSLDPRAELSTVLSTAREALHEGFHIDHATLQLEPAGEQGHCTPTSW